MRININGQTYTEIICFIYVNNISLPLQKSNLISNFNISSVTTLYFTLKMVIDLILLMLMMIFNFHILIRHQIYILSTNSV